MATTQVYKGSTTKQYGIINNFNKGIDRKTADDVSLDSSFKELKNFSNEKEGYLSKRPGVYNSNLKEFIEAILNGDYNSDVFVLQDNDLGDTVETYIENLRDAYNVHFNNQIKKAETSVEDRYRCFSPRNIVGFEVINNNKFLNVLNYYGFIMQGTYFIDFNTVDMNFSFIIMTGGDCYIEEDEGAKENNFHFGLYISRICFKLVYNILNQKYNLKIECDSVDPTLNIDSNETLKSYFRWTYEPENAISLNNLVGDSTPPKITNYYFSKLDMVNRLGYTYIPTGNGYLIKIENSPKERTINGYGESSIITAIGNQFDISSLDENLYAPDALEVQQVGFNILSSNPVSFIADSSTQTTVKVKGIFYTINVTKGDDTFEQPVLTVPFDREFKIHVIYTGSTAPTADIMYRYNNGDNDEETNPYKKLDGSWTKTTNPAEWTCPSFNNTQACQIKITLGDDNFIAFLTGSSTAIEETSYINTINDLVLSSTHAKLIGTQLVLYGGHGYVFFSEFDVFNYFPNYNHIYVADTTDEEVVSMNYFRQYYAVFTNKKIKKMTGSFGQDDFGFYALNDFVGCANADTIAAYGNNLLFLSNDGIYQLKQGYLGEGTENVEKIDDVLGGELNKNNVLQAFLIKNEYIVVKSDGRTWFKLDLDTGAFYEYNLESTNAQVYDGQEPETQFNLKYPSFYTVFSDSLFDSSGAYTIVPMQVMTFDMETAKYIPGQFNIMIYRPEVPSYLNVDESHTDGYGFISSLETHNINMGYPTHTKKFKDLFIKLSSESGHAIPLYVTIYVDDNIVVSPDDYEIVHDEPSNTYYYVKKTTSNVKLKTDAVLGEFTLGADKLGANTVQQVKFRISKAGKSIRIKLSDGYDDTTNLVSLGVPQRYRNNYDFAISTIGIVYKVKKVKEG